MKEIDFSTPVTRCSTFLVIIELGLPVVKQPRSSLELVSVAAVEKETSLERVL